MINTVFENAIRIIFAEFRPYKNFRIFDNLVINQRGCNINVNKLGKYLQLNSVQSEEVANICDYFSEQMSRATTAKKDKEAKLRNAVYGNLKLMRKTLSAEQYAKYAALMNLTLLNKGIDLSK